MTSHCYLRIGGTDPGHKRDSNLTCTILFTTDDEGFLPVKIHTPREGRMPPHSQQGRDLLNSGWFN